jgi:hypothetical protein
MGFLAAFILAVIVTSVFTIGYRGRQSSPVPFIIFFFVLFLTGVAAQYWIVPFGPTAWGVSWIPLLFLILLFSFLFAAPSPYEGSKAKAAVEAEEAAGAFAAISLFVWLIFLVLFVAIIIGGLKVPPATPLS